MSVPDPASNAASSATDAPGQAAPGIGDAFQSISQAGRDSLDSSRDILRATRRLVAADLAHTRIAAGRAAVWLAVAVTFGASAWLLLMLSLILGLHVLGLSWLAAASISAGVSLVVASIGAAQTLRYFEMASMEATRKRLAQLSRNDHDDEEDPVPEGHTLTLDQVKRRIERANRVIDGRRAQLGENLRQVRGTWAAAWTPLRILGAGLGLGFVSARMDPEKAAAGAASRFASAPKILQMLTSLSGLIAATKAQMAAEEVAETQAEMQDPAAADSNDDGDVHQPAAAEAATDLGQEPPR